MWNPRECESQGSRRTVQGENPSRWILHWLIFYFMKQNPEQYNSTGHFLFKIILTEKRREPSDFQYLCESTHSCECPAGLELFGTLQFEREGKGCTVKMKQLAF